MKDKPTKRRWLAVLLGTLLACVACEIALSGHEAFRPYPRYAPGEHEDDPSLSTFLTRDPVTGWSMRPSFEYRHVTDEFDVLYRSNAQGFRSEREFDDHLPLRRIALIGDSYSFGIGADYGDTFASRLEVLTGSAVCNLAMPGFAVDQMWLQLERALELQPELVIVAVCDADLARSLTAFSLGNGMNKPAFLLEGGHLRPMTHEDRLGPVRRFLEERSRLWMATRQVSRRLGYRKPWGSWWRLNEALLDQIRAACEKADVPLAFVYVPTPECRPFPTLERYMSARGDSFLNLSEVMRGERSSLFYPADRHFTPAGHAKAAEAIHAAFYAGQRQGLLSRGG